MTEMFRPILAPNEQVNLDELYDRLPYPIYVSPKIDGIRGYVKGNIVISRTGKPLRSIQVQETFSKVNHLDGELYVGPPYTEGIYNLSQSHIMSANKPHDDLRYSVFDFCRSDCLNEPFHNRLALANQGVLELRQLLESEGFPKEYVAQRVALVPHVLVHSREALEELEAKYLDRGYEGMMGRTPYSIYKTNRVTLNENFFWKFKRFEDTEVLIVGFNEEMTNANPQETSELGFAKRSDKKEGKVPAGRVGSFIGISKEGEYWKVMPGTFKKDQLKEIFENQPNFLHKYLKVKVFRKNMKDIPRYVRAVGFRDPIDF